MIERILNFSIHWRGLALLGTLALAALGVYNYGQLPIDAAPDITNVQVQINAEARGYSPLESEQRVTFIIETAMSGLPRLSEVRSLSRYGLSQVTVVFEDGVDIYFARRMVSERLQEIRSQLPPEVEPTMGPIATGLGEIYMYTVKALPGSVKESGEPYTPMDLREIQDWVIKPQLRTVPGVTEVNTIGGFLKQFHVQPRLDQMIAYQLDFTDIANAIEAANSNIGAGYLERGGEQYLARAPGQLKGNADLREVIVGFHEGAPILLKEVADVALGSELRTGAATENGEEVVLGTVMMLMGENSRMVAERVADKMEMVNASLPDGVVAESVYNRTKLVDATISTVKTNLMEGAALVIVVLFVLLGNFRAALITAFVIPLSMLFTITGMTWGGVSGNLMSLGALDFGLIVDGAVIIVENCIRRLGEARKDHHGTLPARDRFHVVFQATKEVTRPSIFGIMIIMVVYLPILSLTGVEGKMFRPMALTVIMALVGAMIFSLTFVPASIAIFLSGNVEEKESGLYHKMVSGYGRILDWTTRYRNITVGVAAALVVGCAAISTTMGREFVPSLDEQDIALHAMRIPGTSLTQAVKMQHSVEEKLTEIPEIQSTYSKIGTAEIANDPMPPNVADGFVIVKPRSEWPDPKKPKQQLVEEIEEKLMELPGNNYEFTQPVEMRFNELIAGVRSDLAVKIFGDDMDQLLAVGEEVEKVLEQVPGASDVKVEQVSGLPMLSIEIDRARLARYGAPLKSVQDAVQAAIGGKGAGQIFEGDRRFDIVIRLPEGLRNDETALKNIPILLPGHESFSRRPPEAEAEHLMQFQLPRSIPLSSVAEFNWTQGPNQISRENGKRRVVVTANIRGRDIGAFVEEAQRSLQQKVNIPPGYWVDWGGQFEQMISAANRLKVIAPLALGLIGILLFITLRSIKDSLLVFSGAPLALTGGILALFVRGIPLSISAGVGFIALSGIAALNGLVMVTFIRDLMSKGVEMEKAVSQGSRSRLRPVLMTALVASLGFVPMALATGPGAEVQRPLATVVIGGIISSTALTLFVLPALFRMMNKKA